MAKKASFPARTKSGETVNVYGEVTADGMVRVWTKYANYGFYKIERFANNTLTAKTLEAVLRGN